MTESSKHITETLLTPHLTAEVILHVKCMLVGSIVAVVPQDGKGGLSPENLSTCRYRTLEASVIIVILCGFRCSLYQYLLEKGAVD